MSISIICESMWIRRRGPQAMNRDEGAHFLSHPFDPFLTGSTPSTAQRSNRKEGLINIILKMGIVQDT